MVCVGCPQPRGGRVVVGCCFCPLASLPRPAPALHLHSVIPKTMEIWRVITTASDVEIVMQGPGGRRSPECCAFPGTTSCTTYNGYKRWRAEWPFQCLCQGLGGSDAIPYCSPRYPFVRAILQPLSHVVARPFNPFAPSGKPADFRVSGLHQEILNSPVNGFESQTQDAVDVS